MDRGKISAKEGGTRVPLIITGPGIPAGVQTDVMVNGLDFYPTILAMTETPPAEGKNFDGSNLLPLLKGDPRDPELVQNTDGSTRDTMAWHFPHGGALESTLRVGDYKLIRNYDHVQNPSTPELELFRLYETIEGEQKRVDIEEAKNLAEAMPEKTKEMNERLSEILEGMKASYPYYNPNTGGVLPNKEKAPIVLSHQSEGESVVFSYQEKGAKVTRANLIYTLNGGDRYEEWFRMPASLIEGAQVSVELPKGTTHYYLNLIDENNFLRSYPEVVGSKKTKSYSEGAIATAGVAAKKPAEAPKKEKGKADRNIPFDRWDTNKDDILTLEEYLKGQSGPDLEARYKRFDHNNDGKVTREEYVVLSAK